MFKTVSTNGVVFLRSDIIPAPHAFSTRLGGKSTLPSTASMNFGSSIDDEWVNENINIFTQNAELPSKTVRTKQIHSADIAQLYNQKDFSRIDDSGFLNQSCDGFISSLPSLSLCIRTADCLPIIMSNRDGSTVGALHAGWRGSVSGIAKEAVSIFISRGIDKNDIFVALGPCISACCFVVGEDFINNFLKSSVAHFYNEVIIKRNGNFFCDLKKLNYLILRECGIPHHNIDICDECTHHNPHLFYSHRLTGFERGTMGNLVCASKKSIFRC